MAGPASPGPRLLGWPHLLVAGALVALAFPFATARAPLLEHDVLVQSLALPRQAAPGQAVLVELEFQPSGPLPGEWWVLLYTDARDPKGDCEVSVKSAPATPSRDWSTTPIWHRAELRLPPGCTPGPLDVYFGLYQRETQDLLPTRRPRISHDRVLVGTLTVVEGAPEATRHTVPGAAMTRAAYSRVLQPWVGWATAAALSLLLAALLARRGKPGGAPSSGPQPWLGWLGFAAPLASYLVGALVVLDFFKDDAFISFRYARNLASGQGLVFNAGERVEGITNFLWTMILVPFAWLQLDLILVSQILGVALAVALLIVVLRASRFFHGATPHQAHLWAAVWLSGSSTFVVYASSGMEQSLAALLPFSSAMLAWTGPASGPSLRRSIGAGLLAALSCMTRPELQLVAGLLGLPFLVEAVTARRLTRSLLGYALALGLPLLAFHALRYGYFGSLVPNTYFAKTGTGDLLWRSGLEVTHEMLSFNGIGALLLLAPFAFVDPTHRLKKAVMFAICLAFLVFQFRVGADEMHWYRLYLPALPFLAMLAALGLQALLALAASSRSVARAASAVVWLAVVAQSLASQQVTWRQYNGLDGYADLAGRPEADIGRFLTRHTRAGGLVASQDMGSTPYHAPDLRFLDFIGLVDPVVARTRHQLGLHAFLSEGRSAVERDFSARMRAYFAQRDPEWTLLTVYPPASQVEEIGRLYALNPSSESMLDAYAENNHHFGLWGDARFRERYVHVRTWKISRDYYVSAFRRRDLWEQTPGEVVVESLPAKLGGASAALEEGLELLGAEVQSPAIERQEAMITTWWRLPGPLPADLVFSLHLRRGQVQASSVHLPGDGMYGAERWRQGELLEDRVAFVLPPELGPGQYDVSVEVSRRDSGRVFGVVPLGTLEVRAWRPWRDFLIAPTEVSTMRRHPERLGTPVQ